MTTLIITTREGETSTIDATIGASLMDTIVNSGVGDLLALCGGCRSCATCHVYVDAPATLLGEPTLDEQELLSSSEFRTGQSRLSCQVTISAAMDGMRVTIAPEG
jgi:2Fe-2S ferredoxin